MRILLLMILMAMLTGHINAQNWLSDFETAKEIADQENKPIILSFQGSDWCAPCMKLEKEIWSTEEFKLHSGTHYILLKADFPKRSKNSLDPVQQEKNKQLAERYNKNGYFPFVVVLDKSGKVLGALGYKNVSPNEYINLIDSFVN